MLRTAIVSMLLAFGTPKPLEGVSLRWKPTDSAARVLTEASRTFKEKKVQVLPFTDGRDDKALIGRNTEDETPRNVTTKDDVGAWCAAQVSALLEQAGVPVVTEGAEVVLSGEVTRFMVEEGNRYRGVVSLRITARDGAGKELWRGVVSGDHDRWGRSYKEENYMETLSNSLLAATSGLVTDPELRAKLQ